MTMKPPVSGCTQKTINLELTASSRKRESFSSALQELCVVSSELGGLVCLTDVSDKPT